MGEHRGRASSCEEIFLVGRSYAGQSTRRDVDCSRFCLHGFSLSKYENSPFSQQGARRAQRQQQGLTSGTDGLHWGSCACGLHVGREPCSVDIFPISCFPYIRIKSKLEQAHSQKIAKKVPLTTTCSMALVQPLAFISTLATPTGSPCS